MYVRTRDKQRGVALIIALLVSMILLGIGLILVFLTDIHARMTSTLARGQQGYYLADVELVFQGIASQVIIEYTSNRQINRLLGNGPLPSPLDSTHTAVRNLPACQSQIPNTLQDLQGWQRKGQLLPALSTWDMGDPSQNPFGMVCRFRNYFCNCRLVADVNVFSTPAVTLFVRDDSQDPDTSPLTDANMELTVVAVAEMPAIRAGSLTITPRPPSRVVLAFDVMIATPPTGPGAKPQLHGAE